MSRLLRLLSTLVFIAWARLQTSIVDSLANYHPIRSACAARVVSLNKALNHSRKGTVSPRIADELSQLVRQNVRLSFLPPRDNCLAKNGQFQIDRLYQICFPN